MSSMPEPETASDAEPQLTEAPPAEASATEESASPDAERRRIEEQLAQLEKKQAELRRALAIADHPTLSTAIREIEGRVYGLSRAEERLTQPLSKSEERRRVTLEKKLEVAQAKRAELDVAIAELEAALAALTGERLEALRAAHETALRALFVVFARHADAFEAAGQKVTSLIPELESWLPALRALADERAVEA